MNEFLVIILAGIAAFTSGFLILKPQSYKDEMAGIGHLFGRFSPWAIRVLGIFLIVFAIGFVYLATK